MEKNYYKILEVDKDASYEIIKKAYTTLAKKYHPDLQEDTIKKIEFEKKLKLINEAYEVLSNEKKRKEYDIKLSTIEPNPYDLLNENINLKNELNNLRHKNSLNYNNQDYNQPSKTTNKYDDTLLKQQELEYKEQLTQEYKKKINQSRRQAYHDAYIQYLKNRGYKIKYKKTLKDYLKDIVALVCTIFILLIILQLPFVKKYFINLYYDNEIIRFLINIIKNIFK